VLPVAVVGAALPVSVVVGAADAEVVEVALPELVGAEPPVPVYAVIPFWIAAAISSARVLPVLGMMEGSEGSFERRTADRALEAVSCC